MWGPRTKGPDLVNSGRFPATQEEDERKVHYLRYKETRSFVDGKSLVSVTHPPLLLWFPKEPTRWTSY